MVAFTQKMPGDIERELAARVKARRKERGLTQAQLACKAGMSLSSCKRFDQHEQIAFNSLVKLAIAIDCEDGFDTLFSQRGYRSIQDVINDAR